MRDARRTVLVTGASAGIGRAFAEVFAEAGFDPLLTARRVDRLEALAADLESRFGVRPRVLPADLGEAGAVTRLVESLDEARVTVDALVNNAGYGLAAGFTEAPWDDERAFLRVLVLAPTELCRRLVPGMRDRGFGRVVNVASVAAFLPPRPGDVYSATKAYLVRMSKSMALELRGTGVHVTALCPGLTRTEFHDVMRVRAQVDRAPEALWMDATTVAREGFDAVMRGKRVHVNGRLNRVIAFLGPRLPDGLVYALAPRGALERRRPGPPGSHGSPGPPGSAGPTPGAESPRGGAPGSGSP